MRENYRPVQFIKIKKEEVDVDKLYDGILKRDKVSLARAITLIESNHPQHFEKGQQLLQKLLPYTGNSVRIGITGVPGAGKSTFIEAFGLYLCEQGKKVAVLAIDPSSTVTGGSILGDKTRMERLSRHDLAFIRPSPSEGTLGGVHRKTRETMLLCEAAGYEVILIETVGVGQSEITVREMVDFFLLLVITGAGDDLQGIKKGIMELADGIFINKADGENKVVAEKTKREYNQILSLLQPATKGWQTKAYTCSALYHEGIDNVWHVIHQFIHTTKESGAFDERRKEQTAAWLKTMIHQQLTNHFLNHPKVQHYFPKLERDVIEGRETVTTAVTTLFQLYLQALKEDSD